MAVALQVNPKDNVATVFENGVTKGQTVEVRDKTGNSAPMNVLSDIPYGHKLALRDIHVGESIVKYGEQIGVASREIQRGEHVHVQNLESTRGRGDRERV